jgi:hypothetical protein
MTIKGFESGYAHRIMELVLGGKTASCINWEIGPYFRNEGGSPRGSHIDFIADALAAMLEAATVAAVSHLIHE